jgi:hypothetical protein
VSEAIAQGHEGLDAHGWRWSLSRLGTRQGLKPPRGEGTLDPLGELAHNTLCGLASQPPANLDGLSTEGMMGVRDLGYRRRMSSVVMRVASVSPVTCWRLASICAVSNSCEGIRVYARPAAICM